MYDLGNVNGIKEDVNCNGCSLDLQTEKSSINEYRCLIYYADTDSAM